MIISLGLLVLSACGTNNGEEGTSTETIQAESVVSESTSSQAEESSTEEISLQEEYNEIYTDGLAQYDAGKYDEAAGTIGLLLQNDLSQYEELKIKAVSLEEKINLVQAEEAQADEEATAIIEKSTYKTERTSDLANSEFTEATGKDINTVSDDEISTWISDKEAEVEEVLKETTQATPEEEMTEVLNQVVAISGIAAEDNQFYATKTDEQTYTIEIRHSHEVDGVGISNMVGMFKYDLTTKELQKMDPLTGEYKVGNNRPGKV